MNSVPQHATMRSQSDSNHTARSRFHSKTPLVVFILGVALAPFLMSTGGYLETVLIMMGLFGVLALSTDLLLGRLGLPSLANGALFAVGAYAVAVLTALHGYSFWPSLAAAICFSALVGLCFGYVTMRSSGHYFAVSSLAFAGAIVVILTTWDSVTRGAAGIFGIKRPVDINLFGSLKLSLSTSQGMFYLVALLVAVSLLVIYALDRSNFGRRMRLIKVDPVLAGALGVDVFTSKLLAFTISAAMAGAAGGFYASYTSYIDPTLAGYQTGFIALVYCIVGGSGRLFGPLVGTVVVLGLSEALRVTNNLSQLFVGVALILILLFMPGGLEGVMDRLFLRSKRIGLGEEGSSSTVTDVFDRINLPASNVSKRSQTRPVPCLVSSDLTKSYGVIKAVDGIGLSVGSGEIVGVMGPNGAGKSTLLGMISGTIPSSSGDVVVDGESVAKLKAFQRSRRGIARTFQTNRVLMDSTVRENILAAALSNSSSRLRVHGLPRHSTSDVDVVSRVLRSTRLENRSEVLASSLTVEEQRLLGVAMALAARPIVLLLDEPFAGLREIETPRLRSVLERLRDDGLAIIIVEHKLSVLTALSDYMYVLDRGIVISSGPPRSVLNDPKVIEAYLGSANVAVE